MRDRLRQLPYPDAMGLAYEVWAPVGPGGKVAEDDRTKWLDQLARLPVSPDYRPAFERWRTTFIRPGDRTVEVELRSRLMVGHGNPSPTEVGLTTHRTWGVPVVPGTALKGLLAHYVDAVYGPSDQNLPPWERSGEEQERARYQGTVWDESRRRVLRGPGDEHRILFGSPDADGDDVYREHNLPAGAARGKVLFHDALYVPGSARAGSSPTEGGRPEAEGDCPFAVDVLTVHQKPYYDAAGKAPPNDYSPPVPIGFLSVRPTARLLIALSGPEEWTERAERLLLVALDKWGVGAKTTSGYGRMVRHEVGNGARNVEGSGAERSAPAPASEPGERVTVMRVEDPKGRGRPSFRAPDGRLGYFAGEPAPVVEIGATVEVWVANVSPHGYTLTLRQPSLGRRVTGQRRPGRPR